MTGMSHRLYSGCLQCLESFVNLLDFSIFVEAVKPATPDSMLAQRLRTRNVLECFDHRLPGNAGRRKGAANLLQPGRRQSSILRPLGILQRPAQAAMAADGTNCGRFRIPP